MKTPKKIINRDYLLTVLSGYYDIKAQQSAGSYNLKIYGQKKPVATLCVAGGNIEIIFN